MYVCMIMDLCISGNIYIFISLLRNLQKIQNARMYICIYVCMYVCR